MPDSQIRRSVPGTRREGRRSHSAYGSHARGVRVLFGDDRVVRIVQRGRRRCAAEEIDAGGWSAGTALALVVPLLMRARRALAAYTGVGADLPQRGGSEGTGCMKRKPSVRSLETVSLDEAMAYLDHEGGDELSAAHALAWDRNRMDGSHLAPDNAEIHHALFLLCRARGQHPPSFDEMRVELRRRAAA
jgi:hypothetical protein